MSGKRQGSLRERFPFLEKMIRKLTILYNNLKIQSDNTLVTIANLFYINRVIVNQGNVSSTLGGIINSNKEYFIDGVIDTTGINIEIPIGGISLRGYNFDLSKLVCTADNYTLFTKSVVGSGNVLEQDLAYEISGLNSRVYDLKGATGFEAKETIRVNYNNCSSLGIIDNYRQGFETGTGRFGGTPELILAGTWVGGYFIDSSIVRNLVSGTYSLYKAGVGFSMTSRFRSNQNIDLPTSASFLDFSQNNFINSNTLDLNDCRITRNGISNLNDPNITPNIEAGNLVCVWKNNQGIHNTNVGGEALVIGEVTTSIISSNVWYDLLGTYQISNLQHFDSPAPGQLRHIGDNPIEYRLIYNYVIEAQRNTDVALKIVAYRASTNSFEDIKIQRRKIDNLQGVRDVAYYSLTNHLILNKNDYIKIQVMNLTDSNNATAELDSYYLIEER